MPSTASTGRRASSARRSPPAAASTTSQSWPERIGAVTVDEVNAAARLVIREDVAVTGVMLPEPSS